MDTRTNDALRKLEREVAELQIATSRIPVREAKVTVWGEVIRVLVNEPAGVSSGDAFFDFDNAVGQTAPVDGTGVAYNIYQQTYADNDVVWLFWNPNLSRWETERGGSAGSLLIYFELTEDKAYADAAKLA